jgi:hypothetical protein
MSYRLVAVIYLETSRDLNFGIVIPSEQITETEIDVIRSTVDSNDFRSDGHLDVIERSVGIDGFLAKCLDVGIQRWGEYEKHGPVIVTHGKYSGRITHHLNYLGVNLLEEGELATRVFSTRFDTF